MSYYQISSLGQARLLSLGAEERSSIHVTVPPAADESSKRTTAAASPITAAAGPPLLATAVPRSANAAKIGSADVGLLIAYQLSKLATSGDILKSLQPALQTALGVLLQGKITSLDQRAATAQAKALIPATVTVSNFPFKLQSYIDAAVKAALATPSAQAPALVASTIASAADIPSKRIPAAVDPTLLVAATAAKADAKKAAEEAAAAAAAAAAAPAAAAPVAPAASAVDYKTPFLANCAIAGGTQGTSSAGLPTCTVAGTVVTLNVDGTTTTSTAETTSKVGTVVAVGGALAVLGWLLLR